MLNPTDYWYWCELLESGREFRKFMKLTNEQWNKLTREEKQKALLEFREPDYIHHSEYINVNRVDKERFI